MTEHGIAVADWAGNTAGEPAGEGAGCELTVAIGMTRCSSEDPYVHPKVLAI
jgi:hypothetical protein